jgi:sulfoxide reductase heme-binding subunit YedZ
VTTNQTIRWVAKPAVFILALAPALYLSWALATAVNPAFGGPALSANPLSDVTNETGVWTLRFLCITLAVTPLRRVSGWNNVVRFRRMLGLYAFFYGTLHFLTYLILDRVASLDFPNGIVSWTTAVALSKSIGADILKRPFITVGFTAFVSMIPLAVTSTAGMIRRMGGRRWQALHKVIYFTGVAGVVHYWWLIKLDIRRPLIYGAVVAILLGYRVYWARFRRAPAAARR